MAQTQKSKIRRNTSKYVTWIRSYPIVRFKSFAIQMCSEENHLAAKLIGTTLTVNNFKPVLNFPWSYILLVQISHWRALLWSSNHFANHCVHHNCAGPTHFVSYLRTPVVLFQHLSQPLSFQHEVSRSPLSAHRCGSVSSHPIPPKEKI